MRFDPRPVLRKQRPARAIRGALGLLVALLGVSAGAAPDGLATSGEYIVGFVRYVRWQNEDNAEAWHVCIVGNVPLEQDKAYLSEIVRGKHFVVRRIDPSDPIAGCHVLDLTRTDAATAISLLQHARHLPVLSIGSGSAFCSEGGLICLNLQGAEQKFAINLSAVRESGLNVSARLLMLGSGRTADKGVP